MRRPRSDWRAGSPIPRCTPRGWDGTRSCWSRRRRTRLPTARDPLILFDKGSSDWILITGFFRRGGLLPNVVLELEGIEAAKKMVEKGIGIAMLPQMAVRQELHRGSLVHITISDARPLWRSVDLVYRRKRVLSEIARAFRHHVQTAFPALEDAEPAAAVRRPLKARQRKR